MMFVVRSASIVRRLGLVALMAACYTSPDPRRSLSSISATGVSGRVHVVGGPDLEGELLAVSDTAYVMLVSSRVTVARYSALSQAQFAFVGQVTQAAGEVPTTKRRGNLRNYSRFPYGIPAPAMAALLAKSGQTAPDEVHPPR